MWSYTPEERRATAAAGRAELVAGGKCINGATHGSATHGKLCAWCRAVHNLGIAVVLDLDARGEAPARPPGYAYRPREAQNPDTVVAGDLVSAQAIVEAQYGATFEQEGWSIDEWEEVPGDKVITIRNFNDCGHDDKVTRTAAEWAVSEGPCFLCSTEW